MRVCNAPRTVFCLLVVAIVAPVSQSLAQGAEPLQGAEVELTRRAVYAGLGSFGIPASLNYEHAWHHSDARLARQIRFMAGVGYWYHGGLDVKEQFGYVFAAGSYAVGRTLQAEIGGTVALEGYRTGYLSVSDGFRSALRVWPFIGVRYEGRRVGLRVSLTYAPVGEEKVRGFSYPEPRPFSSDFIPGVGVGFRF